MIEVIYSANGHCKNQQQQRMTEGATTACYGSSGSSVKSAYQSMLSAFVLMIIPSRED